eukprot:gnl/Dysnectes_brevis/478_a531_3237.p1 GENE.gnl/Dysnectes_brevis/478_a531_3237~~gnl/Dysnectes_brevis/478_a531_3237.p1  ORF type:complete len:796 (-),score=305.95 gnl/Dysnectes_brevis/478_a531_3237:79-2466(-)
MEAIKLSQLETEISKCLYCRAPGCEKGCPVGINPAKFLKAAQNGTPDDFKRATALIMDKNPFGTVCGYLCSDQFCMKKCSRGRLDSSIQIPKSQAGIIERARELGVFPEFKADELNGRTVAIIGAGPAGLTTAAFLARRGWKVTVYDAADQPGGAAALVPAKRMPKKALANDIAFCLSIGAIEMKLSTKVAAEELEKEHDAVIVTGGAQWTSQEVEGETISSYALLKGEVDLSALKGTSVGVFGRGPIALDCCITLKAAKVEPVLFAPCPARQLGLGATERAQLMKTAEVVTQAVAVAVGEEGVTVARVKAGKVVPESRHTWTDLKGAVVIGEAVKAEKKAPSGKTHYCVPANTVVEAVANAKAVAAAVAGEEGSPKDLCIGGYNQHPVSLQTDFFGRVLPNPFILSASPLTDGLAECRLGLDAGWAGVVLKTCFDGLFPIHIPDGYMGRLGDEWHANADNVSGRTLDMQIADIKVLLEEYPDRLICGATGGPVGGTDEFCCSGWQSNTSKLESSNCHAIEYSLSCPQGGDGSEGTIAAQSPSMASKIVRWILSTPNANFNIPKLFKLSGAVTSIHKIVSAVKEVMLEFPDHKCGITLANSFPSAIFRPTVRGDARRWDDAMVVGMSGAGVKAISNLTLASVADIPIHISGNGGVVDYRGAADFLALGVETVQICALAEERGVRIVEDLNAGLSHFMAGNGFESISDMIGAAKIGGHPICDFETLPAHKKVAKLTKPRQCVACLTCVDCPYQAISGMPIRIDPLKCIGCSLCTLRCPGSCLEMVDRPEGMPQPLI